METNEYITFIYVYTHVCIYIRIYICIYMCVMCTSSQMNRMKFGHAIPRWAFLHGSHTSIEFRKRQRMESAEFVPRVPHNFRSHTDFKLYVSISDIYLEFSRRH